MNTHWMIPLALALNLAILLPLCWALLTRSPGMDQSFGPATDARLILTAVYMAIAAVSAGLLAALFAGAAWAAPARLGLFGVQITYKLLTVLLVGLSSPVVLTNLFVVAFQCAAIAALWRA